MKTDAKFYKPGQSDPVTVDVWNTSFVLEEMYPLSLTPTGNRISRGVADDITRGRFQLDVMQEEDDRKLSMFFDNFWDAFNRAIIQQRISGSGFMIKTHPGERAKDLVKPWTDGEIKWIVPETRHMSGNFRVGPVLNPLDWCDEWRWWMYPVDKSRMELLQLHSDETVWHGHGVLEPCRIALWGMHNLEKGTLERISAWALKKLIFRIDPTKSKIFGKDQLERLQEAMNEEDYYLLESAEDVVQLGDTQGHGTELETILLHIISINTKIPEAVLKGAHGGAITGSEVNLTEYGQLLTSEQAKLTRFVKGIMMEYYGYQQEELSTISWNVDFFNTERTKLENRKLQEEINQMEAERTYYEQP